MISRILSIFKKTQSRGLQWLCDRSILEFRIPETPLGKKLNPFNKKIYPVFAVVFRSVQRILAKKPLTPDTLYVFYDLEVSPITFNFSEALGMANHHRAQLGLNHLHMVFVPGPYDGLRKEMDDYARIIDTDSQHWRQYHLLFPLTHLVPACTGFTFCSSRQEAEYLRLKMQPNIYPKQYSTLFPVYFSFYEAARNPSVDIMALQATPKALLYIKEWLEPRAKGRKTIVITLRQYDYMPKRNSNIDAFAQFAHTLNPKEYFVVIVPDAETAMQAPVTALKAFEYFAEACWNLELRAALYESCYLNLGVNNGPFNLCWLNKNCRYIMFKIVTEEVPQTTEEANKRHGFIPGKAPAFAKEYQKWVWESDTFDVIQREFLKMCQYLETHVFQTSVSSDKTASAITKQLVNPGDSIPNKLTNPVTP